MDNLVALIRELLREREQIAFKIWEIDEAMANLRKVMPDTR